jgi:hypothetical protein
MKDNIKKFMDSIMCDCDGYKDHTISSPNLIRERAEQFFLQVEPLDKETQKRFDKLKNNSDEQCGVNEYTWHLVRLDDSDYIENDDIGEEYPTGPIMRALNKFKATSFQIINQHDLDKGCGHQFYAEIMMLSPNEVLRKNGLK